MKNRNILVIPLLLIQLLFLRFWLSCRDFFDYYHFSPYDLELQINEAVSYDGNLPVLIVRFFHNKGTQFVIDVYKRYTHFLDIQLLIALLSFVGLFGLALGVWYFLSEKKKNMKLGVLILSAFLLPLIEVIMNFNLPFVVRLIIIALPFNIISVYGHLRFVKASRPHLVPLTYIALIALSFLWLFIMKSEVFKYCVRI